MQYDVLDRIREQYKGMSKGHKKIASFILEHYDQAVFMTAARLGDALRISESTVVPRWVWEGRDIRSSREPWRNACRTS